MTDEDKPGMRPPAERRTLEDALNIATTAADKLRELLATRPARPGLLELVRWWQTSGELVPQLLADLEGMDCDLAAARAELDCARLQHRSDVEGFESALAQEAHEKSILEQVECDLRGQVDGMRAVVAASVALRAAEGGFDEPIETVADYEALMEAAATAPARTRAALTRWRSAVDQHSDAIAQRDRMEAGHA